MDYSRFGLIRIRFVPFIAQYSIARLIKTKTISVMVQASHLGPCLVQFRVYASVSIRD